MKLKTIDRLILGMILPTEGSLTEMRTVKKTRKAIEFTDGELAALKFEVDSATKQTKWKPEADTAVDIKLSPEGFTLVTAQFEKLATAGKLTEAHLDTYEKFLNALAKA